MRTTSLCPAKNIHIGGGHTVSWLYFSFTVDWTSLLDIPSTRNTPPRILNMNQSQSALGFIPMDGPMLTAAGLFGLFHYDFLKHGL
jgi:hypothetical protein